MTQDAPAAHVSRAEVSSEHLVHSIMAKKPRLGALLRLTAVPFWFDAGLVTALRARDDGQAENVLALLDQFSFVHTGYGRYWYSGDMRDSLLRQWASDPDGLATAHRRACDYFARRLAESPPGNVAVREEYAAAHLYHLLAVDQRQGIERLLALFREASDEHRLASAEKYVRVAKEHGANLSAESRAYLDYLQGRLLQLQGRWPESKAHLEALLTREGLPPVLSARIRRSVADALVPMGQAANAISLYEQALAQFKAAGDPRQAGLTMVALGNAHLNLALGVWGSGWVRLPPAHSWLQPLLGLGHLLVRIPLVLYLLWRLGFRDLLPVVHRIGSEMDWIVARVLVTAADWFHRARGTLGEAQAPGGLVEVREGLAQLYRLLDYPQRAEALNREILEMDAVQEDGYRAARARLGIAHSLLLQGKAGEAADILEELLPVFRHFEHHRRVAQTQTLLAEATLGLDLPDKALEHHREALAEWLATNDLAAATETVHAMEAIQRQRTLSAESQEIVQETSRQLTERRYRVRYFHPMLIAFAQVALLGLVVLFFFTVRLALRSESGTQIDATASLVKPIERQIPTSEELSPDVTVTLDQQLSPSPPVQAVGFIVVASFIGYLLLYTVVGWLVIVTTPIEEIKPGEVQAVLASPEGIRLIKPADDGEQMAWRDASVLLWSDRIVLQRPLQAFSFFALFNGAGPITVSARTRYYQALQGLVRRRLNEHADREVRTYDLGFDVLHSGTGWLFLASLIYLVGFFVVAALKPELATQNYDPIPYNAVDFYWLAYLGLAFPLAWWFAVQPLRAHWLVSVRTPLVWLVGGAGLVLALISLLQIYRWHLPLGRPDVVTPVLAILLIGVSGSHILRARPPAAPGAGKRHAYSLPVRVATGFVAAVTLAAMLFAIGWELVGTHHLAMGNSHLRAAEAYRRDGDEHAAEEAYTHALAAYDRSLALRAEAYVHNSRGAVLTRLGRYQEALNAYRMAWAANPDEPTYVINQALVYESQASAPDIKRPNPDLYDAAIRILTEAIAQMEGRPDDYRPQLANARLLRGAAYYDRGQIYLDDSKSANARGQTSIAAEAHIAAMSDFARAYNDYAWLVGHYPDRAPGYAGRGWARFRLREGLPAGEVAGERDYLQQAITDFWQALRRDQDEISAKTGLGWAHFYYSQTYAACKESEKDPDEARDYRRHLESAISAYDDVIDQEEAAIHYRVRAQLQYLLRFCDGPGGEDRYRKNQYEQARADYDQAIKLREERAVTPEDLSAVWYNRRANLSYALVTYSYTDTEQIEDSKRRALDDYREATEVDPLEREWWDDWINVAHEWRDHAQEIEAYRQMALRGSTAWRDDAYWHLGWLAYLYQRDYEQSLAYSAEALALNPDLSAVHWNEGLVYVVLGEVESAVQSYLNGIEAADRTGVRRKLRYNNAKIDLAPGNIQADPKGVAATFSTLLEAARTRQACALVEEAAPLLMMRAQPAPDERAIYVLWPDDAFLPAARAPGGDWFYGVIKGQGVFGWIDAEPGILSCSFDISMLPVVDPARLRPP